MVKRLLCGVAAALLLLGTAIPSARAQDANYPNRPVKIFIAFPVGGLLDTVSRIVGEKLAGLLGQQFIIEARPGAGGTLATLAVAKSDPDGYTLMMINDNHALNPSVFKSIPYDSVKDFIPIGFVGYTPLILAANPNVPAKDVKELIAIARTKPDAVTYASVGVGSASHLAGEMLGTAAGVKLLHVPYRGGAPALNDLLAGHVNTLFVSPVIGLSNMQAGKLKALAVAAPKRLEILPDLPTMAEAGFPVDASYWFGLVAPAGTPPAIVAKLEGALEKVLEMPDVRKRLTEMGAVITPMKSKEFGDYINAEIVKWADIVKKAGVRPE
jgi:tripartite-type tricarboxylate transporter receptor subunit TctC